MPYSDERAHERLRSELARALIDRGCPAGRARELAADAQHGGWSFSNSDEREGQLEWRGMSVGLDDPDDLGDLHWAVESLVMNVASENAELWDRSLRGESVPAPLWPLPDRRPRS